MRGISILLAIALPAAAAGDERAFGGWSVRCDTAKRCQAAVTVSSRGKVRLIREAGPAGPVTIEIWPTEPSPAAIAVLIDRRQIAGTFLDGDRVRLGDAQAAAIARAMAKGQTMTLRSRGRIIAAFPLTGASATLRYIDAVQGRAGTQGALVALPPPPVRKAPCKHRRC